MGWKYSIFPFFQIIIADVLNLINRPNEAAEIIKIAELDYKRIPNSSLDIGYFEVFDLIKAINLFQLGKINDAKRILKRTKSTDVIFIMHDYFLIQRLMIELQLIQSKNSLKYVAKCNELKKIIKKIKIDPEKCPMNISRFGNTSGGSIPLLIATEMSEINLQDKRFLACGFGVGLSWGTMCFYMEDCHICDLQILELND
jgi:hypothetical protein